MFNTEDDIYNLDFEGYVDRGEGSLRGSYFGCVNKVNQR